MKFVFVVALLFCACGAINPECYNFNSDMSFVFCGLCSTPELRIGLSASNQTLCANPAPPDSFVVDLFSQALLNASALQGHFWNDGGGSEDNYTDCMRHLVAGMPLRDFIRLFEQPLTFSDFLVEHIRYGLRARAQFEWAAALPWELFLEYVLPYTSFNEKHDLWWRWRPRFFQMFAPLVVGATNVTDAAHILAAAIPDAQLLGALGMVSTNGENLYPGPPVSWVSESSPGFLSPQQVVEHGASCTGTAIIMADVFRSLGIAARMAGCSESVAAGDDHHWVEYWDGSVAGPFGDFWHTKEGTSAGNTGGPWDSPSGPMGGCLQGTTPGDQLRTIWASSWSSSTYLPLLWSDNSWSKTWSHVGGINRCGAYCTAWGCGPNRTSFYIQSACEPQL